MNIVLFNFISQCNAAVLSEPCILFRLNIFDKVYLPGKNYCMCTKPVFSVDIMLHIQ